MSHRRLPVVGPNVGDSVEDGAAENHEAVEHGQDLEQVVEEGGAVLEEQQKDGADIDHHAEDGAQQNQVAEQGNSHMHSNWI